MPSSRMTDQAVAAAGGPKRYYLPDCDCAGGDICPVHGPLQRGRTYRKALRAVQAGRLSTADYEAWKRRHARPALRFGRKIRRTKGLSRA